MMNYLCFTDCLFVLLLIFLITFLRKSTRKYSILSIIMILIYIIITWMYWYDNLILRNKGDSIDFIYWVSRGIEALTSSLLAFTGEQMDKVLTNEVVPNLPLLMRRFYKFLVLVSPFTTTGWILNMLTTFFQPWLLQYRMMLKEKIVIFSHVNQNSIDIAKKIKEKKKILTIYCRCGKKSEKVPDDYRIQLEDMESFMFDGTEEELLKRRWFWKRKSISVYFCSEDWSENAIALARIKGSSEAIGYYAITSHESNAYLSEDNDVKGNSKKNPIYIGDVWTNIYKEKVEKASLNELFSKVIYFIGVGFDGEELLYSQSFSELNESIYAYANNKEEYDLLNIVKKRYSILEPKFEGDKINKVLFESIYNSIREKNNVIILLMSEQDNKNLEILELCKQEFDKMGEFADNGQKIFLLCHVSDYQKSKVFKNRTVKKSNLEYQVDCFGTKKELMEKIALFDTNSNIT